MSIYLHHTVDNDHNWSGWQFTRDDTDVFGFVAIANDDKCPSGKPSICFYFHDIFDGARQILKLLYKIIVCQHLILNFYTFFLQVRNFFTNVYICFLFDQS
jgi:hypothetical protein